MITNLSIKNYALIDDLNVGFMSGLTIITGETGAGKSIILGALSLLLGKRADLSSVKDASKKCVIEANFRIGDYQIQKIFTENDLDYEPITIVRREILPGGKSRAFVNDTPVTLSQLEALGVHLVDVHSQHETLALSNEVFQMEVIDALAGNDALLQEYSNAYEEYRNVATDLEQVLASKETATKELDYHSFLFNELKQASLEKYDQTELENRFETLNNTEEIQETLSRVLQIFSEESIGMLGMAKETRTLLARLQKFSSEFSDYNDRLQSVVIELEDMYESLQNTAENVEADPQKLMEVNTILQNIYKLQQKHTVNSISELIEIQKDLEEKIEGTLQLDDRIEALQKEIEKYRTIALNIATQLHSKRSKAIPILKAKLEEILQELGLPNARFKFDLTPSNRFRSNGTDTLELLFTANKGLSFGALKKVASGGEMSRIMLAVKAVLAEYKKLPTIIFDEIDTGVSGEIANKMASIMNTMSKGMQLLSITHLPQIAAKGDHHIMVYKEDVDEVTQTRLRVLGQEERTVEIAKMIGGNKVTDAAIANAKELLN
ncbi:DNA repair protein RecN [Constantimarinum furrinae]|uniref:DNA repair protein RecN n=1 Tax=Constantimarinum furrinae TaxID=2562285 RepID=A0A7G8PY15_9FLAO|nr:DNA repair protein RecN [Constantimarinum furrinae]QNJ99231.1 DNA recombination protein RecN [Constantimarinum furrinae]